MSRLNLKPCFFRMTILIGLMNSHFTYGNEQFLSPYRGSLLNPYYDRINYSWECGHFSLDADKVNQRIRNARNLPAFYSRSDVEEIMSNPCILTKGVAHRGDIEIAPENTIPAIESAVEKGVDFIEIDVYLNSEGDPIVIHDRFYVKEKRFPFIFDRVAGPTESCFGKNFESAPWDLMQDCNVSRGSTLYPNETVPLLETVLSEYGNGDSVFLIELKKSKNIPILARKVSELLTKYISNPRNRWVSSFEEDALDTIDQSINKIRIIAINRLRLEINNIIKRGIRKGYDAFGVDMLSCTEDLVNYGASKGVGIGAYTLRRNSSKQHLNVIKQGGAFFITDRLSDSIAYK